ncbi:unnamed protein product [Rotaria sp. Silwood2]|nr:unnamed protein product [Rotaria sp. Silwood2]
MVGIDARNKHILDTKYICLVCSLILRDPVQLTECGHRYCQTCLNTQQEMTIKCQQCPTDTLRRKIICTKMKNHYLTEQHQHVVLNVLRQRLSQLNDRNESLQVPISLSTLAEKLLKVKLSVEESSLFLEGMQDNQDLLSQALSSLQEKINDLQYVSYDGTLVWKITNFHEKMLDAQSERQTSIYSPPFYSSPNGYKMRARLYLNGDENARRTHMSLFFVLMRGLNDPILKFPFNYTVIFCLYDQTSAQQHIIGSFRPDIKSSSFQRPRLDRNIASGIPKFCALETLQQEGNPYVRDDTIFIKIMVDFGEIPKTLLPYALCLNSGIPMHIQQAMIQQEAERRAQSRSYDQL